MLERFMGFLGVVLMTVFLGCQPEEKVDIKIKSVPATKVASIACQGPYSEIGPHFGELFSWLGEKEIQPAGPPMGIFHDDPEKVAPEECRYEVCVPVTGEVEGDERVVIKELPETEVVSLLYQGPYEDVAPSWSKMFSYIYRNNYEPTGAGMEVYLNSPEEVPEDSLLTEIRIPVKKK